MRVALIPVKELSLAKARLAPVLDEAGRRRLALALLRDVLAAALGCPALDAVAVTTRDRDVLALVQEIGADPLPEPGGLNEALTSASEALSERGAERLVVLAADLPLAAPEDITAVAEPAADVALVPSRDGGTNALALTPGAISFRFGPDSARLHLVEAERAGLEARRLDLPRLALDIDTPEDLVLIRSNAGLSGPVGRHTRGALAQLGLAAQSV